MFSDSHLQAKEADRAMIASAVEAFYAKGKTAEELAPGEAADLDGRRAGMFVINAEKKERAPAKNGMGPRETIKLATFARMEANKQKRAALALKVALHAGLGDSISQTARALDVSVGHLKRVAKENGITFATSYPNTTTKA